MDDYVTMVVHGAAKVGKTTFGATGPGRTLIFDSEAGGMRFVPGKKVTWDVFRGEDMPDPSGDWQICRVPTDSVQTLLRARDFLLTGRHPFNNIVIDSLTELQDIVKRERSSTFQLEQRDWGVVFGVMNDVVVSMRDLVGDQSSLKSLVVITGTTFKDGLFRPMIAGQFGSKLPYKLDAIGYLHKMKDETDQVRRVLILNESPNYEVGHRLGSACPDVIWEPTVSKTLNAVFATDYPSAV